MSDVPLSEEAMLASLRGLSLPAEAAGGMLADVAVAVGTAALLACLVVAAVRLVSVRRSPVRDDMRAKMIALTNLPEDAQRVALLHLLKSAAPARFDALRGDLYRPDGRLDLATLQAEVARHV